MRMNNGRPHSYRSTKRGGAPRFRTLTRTLYVLTVVCDQVISTLPNAVQIARVALNTDVEAMNVSQVLVVEKFILK